MKEIKLTHKEKFVAVLSAHLSVYSMCYSIFGKNGFQTKIQKAELAEIITGARSSPEFTYEMAKEITDFLEAIGAWTDEMHAIYPNEEIEKRVNEIFIGK